MRKSSKFTFYFFLFFIISCSKTSDTNPTGGTGDTGGTGAGGATNNPPPPVPGTMDSSFGLYGFGTTVVGTNSYAQAGALQKDGKMLIVGGTSSPSYLSVIARFKTNGTMDSTFSSDGRVSNIPGGFYGVTQQPDGKIIAVGLQSNMEAHVYRFNPNGSIDNTFSNDGLDTLKARSAGGIEAFDAAIQSDGKIVVAYIQSPYQGSSVYVYQVGAIRYNTDGTRDLSFGDNSKSLTTVYTGQARVTAMRSKIAIQPDGKIVMSSYAPSGAPNAIEMHIAAVRLNTNGTTDNTFGTNGVAKVAISGHTANPRGLAVQADGKILLGAGIQPTGVSSVGRGALIRLNANGSLDNTFANSGIFTTNIGPTTVDGIKAVAVGVDRKIVAALWSDDKTSTRQGAALIRLNANGTFDNTFGVEGKFRMPSSATTATTQYPDLPVDIAVYENKIYIAGSSLISGGYQFFVGRVHY